MAKKKSKSTSININFLKKNDLNNTKIGKIISWALGIGKTLVFITFTIVIGGFIYRFNLDKQIETLTGDMEDKITIINQYSSSEPKIRHLQQQLNRISTILSTQTDNSRALDTLEKNLPLLSQLENITINNKQITIDGQVKDERIFANFLNQLTQEIDYSQIIVNSLKSGGGGDPEVTFSIMLFLNT